VTGTNKSTAEGTGHSSEYYAQPDVD
jgi:hypothetical protein